MIRKKSLRAGRKGTGCSHLRDRSGKGSLPPDADTNNGIGEILVIRYGSVECPGDSVIIGCLAEIGFFAGSIAAL